MRYRARAPLRIDFGGGWTDVPLYAEREGGAVLNAAITRYAEGSIARPEVTGALRALRGDRSHVSYSVDVPLSAGLGSSAAQTVLWVALVKTSIANVSDREDIAAIACRVSAALGILGGKQDEYASALGGIHYFTFDDAVHPQRLQFDLSFVQRLRSRLVLVYSGERRLSGSIHEHVWGRFRDGNRAVVEALANLRRLAGEMREALGKHDIDQFGSLLSENWANQKALHPSVTDPRLDEIFHRALSNGAMGGKACGAGGGGCVVFVSREGETDRLRQFLRAARLQIIDFDFDSYGVYLQRG